MQMLIAEVKHFTMVQLAEIHTHNISLGIVINNYISFFFLEWTIKGVEAQFNLYIMVFSTNLNMILQ